MRSCRASRADHCPAPGRSVAAVFVGLFVAAWLIPALAVAQTPRSLLPTKPLGFKVNPDSRGTVPSPAAPTPDPAAPKTTPSDATPQGKSGISIDSLNALTDETVGVLDVASGGFDTDLWRDTPRTVINAMIRLLPEAPVSRTALDLRRRLLLSRAAVPPATPPAPDGAPTESRLYHRVHALFRSGDLASAAALLAVVPPGHQEENLSKLTADIAFLRNDTGRACDTVAKWVDKSADRYWQKALVFCEALNGAWEKVDFGMRLLIELNEGDEVFFTLMRAIGGEKGATEKMRAATLRPLDVAMARAARAGLPDPGDATPPRWLLRAFINDPSITPASRFALVEKAETAGIAEAAELVAVYEAMQVSPELLESAASVAAADPSPTGRGLLYRATRAQGSDFGRAQAIKQAADVARERRTLGQTARVYAPLARELNVTSQLGWFAADGALLLLAVHEFDAARAWLGVAERESTFKPEIGAAWRRLWPLARLVGGDEISEWRADRLQGWWDWKRESDPQNASRRAALLFGLLEALDDPVPQTAWRGLVDGSKPEAGSGPGFAVSRALAGAVDDGRVGETVSLITIALGAGSLGEIPTSVLVDGVRGLYVLGMETEARRLALEIALAAGL